LVAFFSAQLCPLRKPAGRKGRTKTTFLGAKKILKTGRENVGSQNVDVDEKQGIHSVVTLNARLPGFISPVMDKKITKFHVTLHKRKTNWPVKENYSQKLPSRPRKSFENDDQACILSS